MATLALTLAAGAIGTFVFCLFSINDLAEEPRPRTEYRDEPNTVR